MAEHAVSAIAAKEMARILSMMFLDRHDSGGLEAAFPLPPDYPALPRPWPCADGCS
jgi:hypothetical protein